MHILHVAHSFLPYSTGGVEVYLDQLARAQSTEYQVSVFHPVMDSDCQPYTLSSNVVSGVAVHQIVIDNTQRVRYGELYNGVLLQRFRELLADIKPDVIHYHSLINLSMCLLSPDIRLPKVYTAHDFWFMCSRVFLIRADHSLCNGPEGGLRCVHCRDDSQGIPNKANPSLRERLFKLRRRLISYDFETIQRDNRVFQYHLRDDYTREKVQRIDLIIALSQSYRERYIAWGIAPEKIVHSRLGLDTQWTTQVVKQPSPRIRFGFVGRIEELKGVTLLVEAFNRLPSDAAALELYGKFTPPAYETKVRSLARHTHIQFKGEFHREQLAEVLSEMDVLVLPSLVYENCPMAVEEALAAKIPVIVSNIGGAAEGIRDGLDGFHFERGQAENLYVKLKAFVDNPELVQRFAATIRPVKTIQENTDELAGLYEKVTAGTR